MRKFQDLFEGCRDAYGTDRGGCVRCYDSHIDLFWKELFRDHLLGINRIGVYPMRTAHTPTGVSWIVKWGCVDFDIKAPGKRRYDFETEDQAHLAAVNLYGALKVCDIESWIERTRSGGRHVWVFMDDWTHASTMRRALLVASEIAGTPTTEVNPKSESLAIGQVGNYVRLPYSEPHGGTDYYQVMVEPDNSFRLALHTFQERVKPNPQGALTSLALACPPVEHSRAQHMASKELVRTSSGVTKKLSGLGWTMFDKGPLSPNVDRSGWLFRLACQCAEDGLTSNEAEAVVYEADDRWCQKFVPRADAMKQIAATVRGAYTRSLTT